MQCITSRGTSRKMVVPTYMPTNLHHALFRQDLKFHKNIFWFSMICFLALHFYVVTSYRHFFSKLISYISTFLYLLCFFLYCCFQQIFPKATAALTAQQSQHHGASGRQHYCCPHMLSLSHLWPKDQLTGTCWRANKHICLAAGVRAWIQLWPPHWENNIWGLPC